MPILNVEQINPIVNEAYAMATGKSDLAPIDLSKVTDVSTLELETIREPFTKALICVITKKWFTDESYRSEYKDSFYVDNAEFGLITQVISATAPEVHENPAWKNFESGKSTVGQYKVYLPIIDNKFYTKISAWALDVAVSWTQWEPACNNKNDLVEFVNYILMIVDNAILMHRENMNNANRNNFIGEKLNQSTGIGYIDLSKHYASTLTNPYAFKASEIIEDKNFLLASISKIWDVCEYMRKPTTKFNNDGKVKFTTEDNLVVQFLSYFANRVDANMLSQVIHDKMIKLPLYESVPFWESIGDASFSDVSAIHAKLNDEKTVETNGIVALIADKKAITHTIVSERVATQHFDIENLTLYSYQFADKYLNNLTQNGIVFVVKDYNPTSTMSLRSTKKK